jgi:hypothetical protein
MDNEKDFILGFNQGYILRKYNLKQFEVLASSINTRNEYLEGFQEGGNEAKLEISKDRLNELDALRSQDDELDLER